jgi:cytoskeleton protein RodZ
MSSVGETLRRERLRSGLDLDKIAQDTKISVRTLELIEADQFEKIPGGVFARSFVRQYARAVGVDEDEIVRELERTLEPVPEALPTAQELSRQQIRMPRVARWGGLQNRTSRDSSLPALVLVVLVMLACSGAYTLWQSRRVPASPVPATATESGKTAKAVPSNPPSPAPSGQVSAPAGAAPAHGTIVEAAQENQAGTMHLALTAAEETWVRATANGKIVFSGVIQPNETKSLEAADTVTLRIGNAGGISITLNGKLIPAVGPKGQVRVVQLTPGGEVQVVPPKPPSDQEPARQTQSL